MTLEARKTILENRVSKTLGRAIELTIRSETEATISTETVDQGLADDFTKFLSGLGSVDSVEHDDECGTFVYFTFKAA